MHLYTTIQIVCIAILWAIKTYISPAFPFGLLSMVLVHWQIKRLFTKEEMAAVSKSLTFFLYYLFFYFNDTYSVC